MKLLLLAALSGLLPANAKVTEFTLENKTDRVAYFKVMAIVPNVPIFTLPIPEHSKMVWKGNKKNGVYFFPQSVTWTCECEVKMKLVK